MFLTILKGTIARELGEFVVRFGDIWDIVESPTPAELFQRLPTQKQRDVQLAQHYGNSPPKAPTLSDGGRPKARCSSRDAVVNKICREHEQSRQVAHALIVDVEL